MGKIMLNDIEYGSGGGGDANEQELTLAEYNELSQAEKMNGTNYFITDAVPEGKEIQPVIYSENEREIGVWTDGKPLYQKTITFTNVTINDSSSYISLGIENVDYIFFTEGTTDDGCILPYTVGNVVTASIGGFFNISANDAQLHLRTGQSRSISGIVTVRYTKTTDTAGSGVWTPSGVPAVHYSTDEQIIGTWMGETLYQKTFELASRVIIGNSFATVIPDITEFNIDKIIASIGYDSGGSTDKYNSCCPAITFAKGDGSTLLAYGGTMSYGITAFTLQYTKTTD